MRNPFRRKQAPQAHVASYKEAAAYPVGATTRETRVTAVLDRDAGTITLINPTDQDLYAVRAWVNGRYVAWVNALPARRTVNLAASEFVDESRQALPLLRTPAETIELYVNGELYRALGPALAPSEADRSGRRIEVAFPPRRD